jgi:sialate O-acetylesterase
MAWTLKQASGGEAAAQVADPLLRVVYPGALPRAALKSPWLEATPETSPNFSAVAFFFGRALRRDLKVPVALLVSAVGGTPAERWMTREAIEKSGAQRVVTGRAVDLGTPAQLGVNTGSLYQRMIVPFQPFAIRGVIWYQGETNQNVGYDYRRTFPALIGNWREAWHQGDFPFLFVQLAGYEDERNKNFVDVRDSQFETLKSTPNTAMIVSIDHSTPTNVHPPAKEPIGERLALAARAVAYGEKLTYSGPQYKSVTFQNGTATISFDSVGQGLEARGGELRGFTIAGEDGNFVPATARIVDQTVVVSSPDIAAPKWVRYAWSNAPDGNLFNRDGLPASPFRSDKLPIGTQVAP